MKYRSMILAVVSAVCLAGSLFAATTPWAGKKVSIVGDSYSTFEGVSGDPQNSGSTKAFEDNAFYPGDSNTVKYESQTWYRLVLKDLGGTLEKNGSVGGSRIAMDVGASAGIPVDGRSLIRSFCNRAAKADGTKLLGNPDVILVFGGTNDSWGKVPEEQFKWAAQALMKELRAVYPNAEVTVILPRLDANNATGILAVYRDQLRTAAAAAGAGTVDLNDAGLSTSDFATGHPTETGMRKIAARVAAVVRANAAADATTPNGLSPNGATLATHRGSVAETGSHKWYYAQSTDARIGLDAGGYRIKNTRESEKNRYRWLMRGTCTDKPLQTTFSWQHGTAPFTLKIVRADGSTFLERRGLTARSLAVDNFEVAARYTWTVTDANGKASASASFSTEENVPRFLNAYGTTALHQSWGKSDYYYEWHNATPHGVRDVGGYKGLDGRRVKQNLVLRTSEFDEEHQYGAKSFIDAANRSFWREFIGVKTEVDLRNSTETRINSSPLGSGVSYKHFTSFSQRPYDYLAYSGAQRQQCLDNIRDAIRLFANRANYPISFHCVHGKDRTGFLSLLLGGILGYSRDDIYKDYEGTMFWNPTQNSANVGASLDWFRTNRVCQASNETDLTAGVVKFVKYCGVSDEEIQSIRDILLEPLDVHTHQWTESSRTAATCTEAGQITYSCQGSGTCSDGGVKYESIPALGHEMGEWAVTRPATTEATGLKTRTCQRTGCGHTEEQVIPMLDPEAVTLTASNISADGKITLTFGPKQTALVLSAAYGTEDREADIASDAPQGWDQFRPIACIPADVSTYVYEIPDDWGDSRYARFFLTPVSKTPMKTLEYVEGFDPVKHYIDTGVKPTTEMMTTATLKLAEGQEGKTVFAASTAGASGTHLVYDMYVNASGYPAFDFRDSTKTSGTGYQTQIGTARADKTQKTDWRIYGSNLTGRYRISGTDWTKSATVTKPTAAAHGSLRLYGVGAISAFSVYVGEDALCYLVPSQGFDADGNPAAGFYDSITHRMFLSEGTESFVAGEEIEYRKDLLKDVGIIGMSEAVSLADRPEPEPDPDPTNVTLAVVMDGKVAHVTVGAFAKPLVLSMVYGAEDRGDNYYADPGPSTTDGWDVFKPVALLDVGTVAQDVEMPAGWGETVRYVRFLLTPADKTPFVSLKTIGGTDPSTQWFDTGLTPTAEMDTSLIFTPNAATAGSTLFDTPAKGTSGSYLRYGLSVSSDRKVQFWYSDSTATGGSGRGEAFGTAMTVGTTYNARVEATSRRGRMRVDGTQSWNNTTAAAVPTATADGTVRVYGSSEIVRFSSTGTPACYMQPCLAYNAEGQLEACLFDSINLKMCFSEGGTPFVGGAEVRYRQDQMANTVRSGETATIAYVDPVVEETAPVIVAPAAGATVDTHQDFQNDYLALPPATRKSDSWFGNAAKRDELIGTRPLNSHPQATVLSWTGVANRWTVRLYNVDADNALVGTWTPLENELAVTNLEIGRNYRWTVENTKGTATGTFTTKGDAPRFICAGEGEDSVPNVRDLGGWIGLNGCRVRQGLLYRTARFDSEAGVDELTATQRAFLHDTLGIRTEIDLRPAPSATSPIGSDVKRLNVIGKSYTHYAQGDASGCDCRVAFKSVFNALIGKSDYAYPMAFHCSAGQDRTGCIAFILEALLGVSEEDCVKDWEATVFCNSIGAFGFLSQTSYQVGDFYDLDVFRRNLATNPGATVREQAESWTLACGFTKDDIEAFRSRMLEGYELPPAYAERFDYLHTDGTGFIVSDLQPNLRRSKIEYVVRFPTLEQNACLFCGNNLVVDPGSGRSQMTVTFFGANSPKMLSYYNCEGESGDYDVAVDASSFSDEDVYTVVCQGADMTVSNANGQVAHVTIADSGTAPDELASGPFVFGMGGWRDSRTHWMFGATLEIRSIRIWTDGELVREYLPCTNALGQAGLWESVNNVCCLPRTTASEAVYVSESFYAANDAGDPWTPPDDDTPAAIADALAADGFGRAVRAAFADLESYTAFKTYCTERLGIVDPKADTSDVKANSLLYYALDATAWPTTLVSEHVKVTAADFASSTLELTLANVVSGENPKRDLLPKAVTAVGGTSLQAMSAANVTVSSVTLDPAGRVRVTVSPKGEATTFFARIVIRQ